jgi:hypothetical protein
VALEAQAIHAARRVAGDEYRKMLLGEIYAHQPGRSKVSSKFYEEEDECFMVCRPAGEELCVCGRGQNKRWMDLNLVTKQAYAGDMPPRHNLAARTGR